MEMGKINWLDASPIAEIRKTHTQKPITAEELQEKHGEVKLQEGRDIGQSSGHFSRRENRIRRLSNDAGGRPSIVYVVTLMTINALMVGTINRVTSYGDMHALHAN
jgi:hypothetical protein